jgi:hypothetical protein
MILVVNKDTGVVVDIDQHYDDRFFDHIDFKGVLPVSFRLDQFTFDGVALSKPVNASDAAKSTLLDQIDLLSVSPALKDVLKQLAS